MSDPETTRKDIERLRLMADGREREVQMFTYETYGDIADSLERLLAIEPVVDAVRGQEQLHSYHGRLPCFCPVCVAVRALDEPTESPEALDWDAIRRVTSILRALGMNEEADKYSRHVLADSRGSEEKP